MAGGCRATTPPLRRPRTSSGSTRGARITGVPMSRAPPSALRRDHGTLHALRGLGRRGAHKNDLAEILVSRTRPSRGGPGRGGTSAREQLLSEFALVAWRRGASAAGEVDVHTREAFLTDYQAAISSRAWSCPRPRATSRLRGVNTEQCGAHAVTFVPLNKGRELSTSVYRVPTAAVARRAVLSNTSPLGAYRSAGRPQVMLRDERLIDLAARVTASIAWRCGGATSCRPGHAIHQSFGIVYDSGRVCGGAGSRGGPRRLGRLQPRSKRGSGPLPRYRRRQTTSRRHRRPARARADHRAPRRVSSTW